MKKYLLSLALSLLVFAPPINHADNAQALMLGRVDGHTVYFNAEQAYVVDSSFEYIGSYTSQLSTKALDQLKQGSKTLVHEVFGKRHNDTNELVMIFIAQWQKFPDRWRVSEPGPIREKMYDFMPTRFTGLADFLKSKGYTYSTNFYGGLLIGNGYLDTYTKYFFAVANTIIPEISGKADYVRAVFNENIKLAH